MRNRENLGPAPQWVTSARWQRVVLLACSASLVGLVQTGCATSHSGGYSDARPSDQRFQMPHKQVRVETPVPAISPEPLFGIGTLEALQGVERRYQAIVSAGGWPKLGSRYGDSFRTGDQQPPLRDLEQRLALSGDLAATGARRNYRSSAEDLSSALQRFQQRHGLPARGKLDAQTLQALDVSAERRLAQIRTNLVRIRRGASAMKRAARYVVVNIPAFQLEAVEAQRVVRRHRVIVGRPERPTPIVDAAIQNLNFYPYWHVPESIVRHDLIPRALKNPNYLRQQHIRVLRDWQGQGVPLETIEWRSAATARLKFRQDPGPWNALGVVRIDMPNKHAVYMHDTPMKTLFRQHHRAFSAGCVRVEGVLDLVAWALRDVPGWDPARIKQVLANGEQFDVALSSPIPVRFVYLTAWADLDGRVSFRQDLYGLDRPTGIASASPRAMASRSPSLSP